MPSRGSAHARCRPGTAQRPMKNRARHGFARSAPAGERGRGTDPARSHILGVLQHAPLLAALNQQGMASQALLEAARPHLPANLAPSVRSGPLQDGTWCLVAPNAAVAAKLRHCVPQLLAALQQSDCGQASQVRAIRIRVARGQA